MQAIDPRFIPDEISIGTSSAQWMFLIVYPQGIEDEITEVLNTVGVPGYTEMQKVIGRGPRGPHFDNPVWPGADGMIYTVVDAEQKGALGSALISFNRDLEQRTRGLSGLHIFSWTCDQLT